MGYMEGVQLAACLGRLLDPSNVDLDSSVLEGAFVFLRLVPAHQVRYLAMVCILLYSKLYRLP